MFSAVPYEDHITIDDTGIACNARNHMRSLGHMTSVDYIRSRRRESCHLIKVVTKNHVNRTTIYILNLILKKSLHAWNARYHMMSFGNLALLLKRSYKEIRDLPRE